MFAVIFEVEPRQGRVEDYLDLAKALRPKLEAIDGFISIERFASKRNAGRMLSLSVFRDEKAVIRWRTHAGHHAGQERGRSEIFADYRLRVGEVMADTAPPQGIAVAQQRFDETEIGDAKAATITELVPEPGRALDPNVIGSADGAPGLIDQEVFESIYNPGKLLVLASWRDAAAANARSPAKPAAAASLRHRAVRIVRDYGMFERREAPQYYPEARRDGRKTAEQSRRAAR